MVILQPIRQNSTYGYNPTFDLWSTGGTPNATDAAYDEVVDQKLVGRDTPGAPAHPSLVCTTTSTRRFGLCSSIDPFGEARNFAAP